MSPTTRGRSKDFQGHPPWVLSVEGPLWGPSCPHLNSHPHPQEAGLLGQPREFLPGLSQPPRFPVWKWALDPPGKHNVRREKSSFELPVCWAQTVGPGPAPHGSQAPCGCGEQAAYPSCCPRSGVSTPEASPLPQGCREVPSEASDSPGTVGWGPPDHAVHPQAGRTPQTPGSWRRSRGRHQGGVDAQWVSTPSSHSSTMGQRG